MGRHRLCAAVPSSSLEPNRTALDLVDQEPIWLNVRHGILSNLLSRDDQGK